MESAENTGESAEPNVGDRLGPYYLQQLVGQGGMGRVFRAVHEKLGRKVAIKLMRRSVSHGEGVKRFLREARAVNKAHHPHLVEITDIVEAPPGGDSYYVMEWMDGKDLHARMVECNGHIPMPEILRIMLDTADALEAAHQAGLIHRDLKPENIYLIERDGRRDYVKVIDFGVARDATDQAPGEEEFIVGTAGYMSPEQAQGKPGDQRSDVYALGVILYELVVGQLPYLAPTMAETVALHLQGHPVRPRKAAPKGIYIPAALERIILSCMATDPAERYPSMSALRAALESVRHQLSLPLWRRTETLRRAGLLLGLAGVLGGAVAGGLAMPDRAGALKDRLLSLVRPTPPQPPPPTEDEALLLQVQVNSTPSGASVFYQGTVVGKTPCVVRLPEGSREIELRRSGYRPHKLVVDVRVGTELNVNLSH